MNEGILAILVIMGRLSLAEAEEMARLLKHLKPGETVETWLHNLHTAKSVLEQHKGERYRDLTRAIVDDAHARRYAAMADAELEPQVEFALDRQSARVQLCSGQWLRLSRKDLPVMAGLRISPAERNAIRDTLHELGTPGLDQWVREVLNNRVAPELRQEQPEPTPLRRIGDDRPRMVHDVVERRNVIVGGNAA